MMVLESHPAYFSQVEMEANFDPPQHREREPWEVTLSKMKKAILDGNVLGARRLMYDLQFEVERAKMAEYKRGVKHALMPLPF